jgi:hypothetical protein
MSLSSITVAAEDNRHHIIKLSSKFMLRRHTMNGEILDWTFHTTRSRLRSGTSCNIHRQWDKI